jgi:hypothetical protein
MSRMIRIENMLILSKGSTAMEGPSGKWSDILFPEPILIGTDR